MTPPAVSGVVSVDLSDMGPWPDATVMRRRLSIIETVPAGAMVRLSVGSARPLPFAFDGLRSEAGTFEVVGADGQTVGEWVRLLRGVGK